VTVGYRLGAFVGGGEAAENQADRAESADTDAGVGDLLLPELVALLGGNCRILCRRSTSARSLRP
jgi:hypothetical protein